MIERPGYGTGQTPRQASDSPARTGTVEVGLRATGM